MVDNPAEGLCAVALGRAMALALAYQFFDHRHEEPAAGNDLLRQAGFRIFAIRPDACCAQPQAGRRDER